jgi:hypothetical protein
MKAANSGQGTEFQLETAASNEMLGPDPVAAQLLQYRRNGFTNAPPDMQQTPTPQDRVFQSNDILNEVEMELIWLGEESMYCLVCVLNFNLTLSSNMCRLH